MSLTISGQITAEPTIRNRFEFSLELRDRSDFGGMPLHTEDITADIGSLVDEARTLAGLGEAFPFDAEDVEIGVEPVSTTEPLVDAIEIRLSGRCSGRPMEYVTTFKSGRWNRTAEQSVLRLREQTRVGADQQVWQMLTARQSREPTNIELPPFFVPNFVQGRLEEFGVRSLGNEVIEADRPVLVDRAVEEAAIRMCLDNGAVEAGAAVLGAIVQLDQPLPGTSTRYVTLLTTCREDARHHGEVMRWDISPDALNEAARIADLRGLNESVMTIVHTHGWGRECGRCNESESCHLPQATHVSHQDYQVLESLFPGKATLMPIAGRQLGASAAGPVLVVHAWKGGRMRPIRWRRFDD